VLSSAPVADLEFVEDEGAQPGNVLESLAALLLTLSRRDSCAVSDPSTQHTASQAAARAANGKLQLRRRKRCA
jgi:hypothetical protein